MRAKHYTTLLIIAAIATSLAITSVPVTAADGDVTFDLTFYYSSTSGIIPGQVPSTTVPVQCDVYVDASALTNNSPEGMRGWGLKVLFDPAVLTPFYWYGSPYYAVTSTTGYVLYDWTCSNWPPPPMGTPPYPPSFIPSNGTDPDTGLHYILITEQFLKLPPEMGFGGTGKLCTILFESHSLTAYTEIELKFEDCGYTEALAGDKYRINPIDGHYNMPSNGYLFEQFTGSTWPPGDPRFTDWHELEPMYCETWTLESWIDNGDGKLTPSDQIDMTRASDSKNFDFHVEWVNPYGTAGDGVADLFVTKKEPVPEFPLGSVAPIALIAAVAYIWWVTRRKRQEAV